MDFARSRKRVRPMQLISLIDMMFFILLFFMFSTSFIHAESMELELPPATSAATATAPAPPNDSLRIFLAANGGILIGEERVEEGQMDEALHTILTRNPQQKMLILADEKVQVQRLVQVMDMIYQRGGKSLSVARWQRSDTQIPAIVIPAGGH